MRFGSTSDYPQLQSLLYEEGIPSLVMNKSGLNVTGGWNVSNPVKIELYILKTDFDKAISLVEDSSFNFFGTFRFYNPAGNEISLKINNSNADESVPLDAEKEQIYTENEKVEEIISEELKKIKKLSSLTKKRGFFSLDGTCSRRLFGLTFLVSIALRIADYIWVNSLTSNTIDIIRIVMMSIIMGIWQYHFNCLLVQRFRSADVHPWLVFVPVFNFLVAFIKPSSADMTTNAYVNREIPHRKLFRSLIVLLAFLVPVYSVLGLVYSPISQTSYTDQSVEYVIEENNVECKKGSDQVGDKYYLNVYDYDEKTIITCVFREKKTLNSFKKLIKKMKKQYGEEEFSKKLEDYIMENSTSNPAIDFYNSDWEVIASFSSKQYGTVILEKIDELNPAMIRLNYYDFDEISINY
ncbi:MAG: hypothetical protein KBT11_00190 [Treponema sp.]|nr:hypothetical protein [Candidatus Treponema equifaecale]